MRTLLAWLWQNESCFHMFVNEREKSGELSEAQSFFLPLAEWSTSDDAHSLRSIETFCNNVAVDWEELLSDGLVNNSLESYCAWIINHAHQIRHREALNQKVIDVGASSVSRNSDCSSSVLGATETEWIGTVALYCVEQKTAFVQQYTTFGLSSDQTVLGSFLVCEYRRENIIGHVCSIISKQKTKASFITYLIAWKRCCSSSNNEQPKNARFAKYSSCNIHRQMGFPYDSLISRPIPIHIDQTGQANKDGLICLLCMVCSHWRADATTSYCCEQKHSMRINETSSIG